MVRFLFFISFLIFTCVCVCVCYSPNGLQSSFVFPLYLFLFYIYILPYYFIFWQGFLFLWFEFLSSGGRTLFAPTYILLVLFFRNNSLYVKNESDLVNYFLFLHFSVFLFLFSPLSVTPWRTQAFHIMLLFRFYFSYFLELLTNIVRFCIILQL